MLQKVLTHHLSKLKEKIIEQQIFLKKWKVKELLYIEPGKYVPFRHKIQRVNRMSKESIIATSQIHTPKFIVNKKVYIHIPAENHVEALLFLNNQPLAGIDGKHQEILLHPDGPHGDHPKGHLRLRHLRLPSCKERDKFQLKIEGKMSISEWRGIEKGIFLFTVNEEVEKYYFDLTVAYEVFQNSDDHLFKEKLWKLIEDSVSEYNRHAHIPAGIKKAQQLLSSGLKSLNLTYKPIGKISLIAHSHIDVAWHWELKETIRKCARTFGTAINLMREYPFFRFPSSQAQLYEYTKQYYPQLYSKIKKAVMTGKWELIGGSWVESDCNIPCGESLVRQHLYGQRFFHKEFGKMTAISWMPDTFGFSGNLPQILAGCGLKYFFTWKMYWQSRDIFPYNLFWWEGIDGSKVLAHLPRLVSGYGGAATPHELFTAWNNFPEKKICNEMMSTYGHGDGGGGVTRQMIEYAKRYDRFPGFPKCKIERADIFFRRIHDKVKNNPDLPTWKGEIYLETHRGTFISKAILKTLNRRAEVLLLNAEKIASFLIANHIKPELSGMEQGWKIILLNQFHDIMAGTSEKEVNEAAVKDYQKALAIGEKIVQKNLEKLGKAIHISDRKNLIIIFNSLSWNRDDIIELKLKKPKKICKNRVLAFVKDIPPMGYKIFEIKNNDVGKEKCSMHVTDRLMENKFYRIKLNNAGEIQVYDKIRGRDVFPEGQFGNILEFFRENPDREEAWNIDRDFAKHREVIKNAQINVDERGPVMVSVRIKKVYNRSAIVQEIRIYENLPRIDFKTMVDWQESQTMLKAFFPINVNSLKATFEIPYGNLERPTHTNTSWDQEKNEVPAQRWADLSEPGFGVSLLNDSKYSYNIKDNLMRITLLRSPDYPEVDADKMAHEFCYSLLTHDGDWRKGGTTRQGYQLNFPLIIKEIKPHTGITSIAHFLAETDRENVIIEVVKKVEDARHAKIDGVSSVLARRTRQGAEGSYNLIMRLYEYSGARGNVNVSLGFKAKEVYETDMLENQKSKIDLTRKRNGFSFFIKPYEIKTFKINLMKH